MPSPRKVIPMHGERAAAPPHPAPASNLVPFVSNFERRVIAYIRTLDQERIDDFMILLCVKSRLGQKIHDEDPTVEMKALIEAYRKEKGA